MAFFMKFILTETFILTTILQTIFKSTPNRFDAAPQRTSGGSLPCTNE